ncbi:hypothetical protein RU97_GL000551 [Enterococcus canis]|uniref:Beta-xylosidase C-terminal Concanavalin A-like domain-containing protein n=1 Tax=Enterococcus canis TaxID=214095 RepID=A0A1L8RKQ3_9ENTE|nr:glycoside hydrolase family 43 protein [Enterococcus canis]OJG20318.1 hypothetical protein RU97_GL000551 [Enterococcus canis]
MKYENPILTGFYPDPSICLVKEDYYLVTSSFEYFPGIPIFHSKDLVNWQQVGHAITRKEQLQLSQKIPNAFGLYAPTIRYIAGRFYIICTNVSPDMPKSGNFLIWAEDPTGPWSDPIWLDLPGIDPSLFLDDDGKVYYCGASEGIFACEIDLTNGHCSSPKKIWNGTGAADPEGPHLYKKDNFYYLLIAEGGTGYGHMVTMARSKSIYGPYQSCPSNPVLTNRSLPNSIQAVGHADLFQDILGNWWAVCLGIRPLPFFPRKHLLGRETNLVPVEWYGDWPKFGNEGSLEQVVETSAIQSEQSLETVHYDDFQTTIGMEWNSLYEYDKKNVHPSSNGLVLQGQAADLNQEANVSWLGRRQQHFDFSATAKFKFPDLIDKEEFGLSIYLNRQAHYDIFVCKRDGNLLVGTRQQVGPFSNVKMEEYSGESVYLRIVGSTDSYQLYAGMDKNRLTKLSAGETKYLTTEVSGVFTGPYIALYATGNGQDMKAPVYCEWFEYQQRNVQEENHVS